MIRVKNFLVRSLAMTRSIWRSKFFQHFLPVFLILFLAFATNFFRIDSKVINWGCLWDAAGRTYSVFLSDLNLPAKVGVLFVSGTPENVVPLERLYKKINTGNIYTIQLGSLLFKTPITEISIPSYINFMFGFFSIIFSVLTGYLIFRNRYASVIVFLMIVIFRNSCQGLIYGLPLKHLFAVFNPPMIGCVLAVIVVFWDQMKKRYICLFPLAGFLMAYVDDCRTSEGLIALYSIMAFTGILFLIGLNKGWKTVGKAIAFLVIFLGAFYSGYWGYQKTVLFFENQRNAKYNFTEDLESLSAQPPFHSLLLSLFRYPNRHNLTFCDRTAIDLIYEKYPEMAQKYKTDYFRLENSFEYNDAIKNTYFQFIANNKKQFMNYLLRSIGDYLLFLPYYTFTGEMSAHAYLPRINPKVPIDKEDLAPDFKDSGFNWIMNLRLKYLPPTIFFWFYFFVSYVLLIEAIVTSCRSFIKILFSKTFSVMPEKELLSVFLLWGMVLYFLMASGVRILIPVHGQGAVVSFNLLIIYNFARLVTFKIERYRIAAGKTA